jgi:hypothetical protein
MREATQDEMDSKPLYITLEFANAIGSYLLSCALRQVTPQINCTEETLRKEMLSRIDFMSKGCPDPNLFAESAIVDYLDDMQANFSGDILISDVVAKADEIADGILVAYNRK